MIGKDKFMKREIPVEELQRLYGLGDLVKADCMGCDGCSACCRGMGSSVVLDPFDLFRMEAGLEVSFGALLEDKIELNTVDGLVLPNIRMSGEGGSCVFLDGSGRCQIHRFRPGLCRLFPLGRYYEGGSFRYYLQKSQCPKENRAKIKVKKWIDTPEPVKNEEYILSWHDFQKKLQACFDRTEEEKLKNDVNTFVLKLFYSEPYDSDHDFYEQFQFRLKKAERLLELIDW